MSGLSRMPFLGVAAARASGYWDDGSTQLYVRQYANCAIGLRERTPLLNSIERVLKKAGLIRAKLSIQ
jgi:hypothetical protein